MAPLNPELHGDVLTGLIDYAAAALLVTTPELLDRVPDTEFETLTQVIVLGESPKDRKRGQLTWLDAKCLAVSDDAPTTPPLAAWDVHTLFFTSGTTGVSKAVESTHAHCTAMAVDGLRFLTEDDRFCTPCGYFHVGGAYAPWAVISAGASMVIVGKFSATRFLDQINTHGVTTALMIGVMCDFLMAQGPRPDDANCVLSTVVSQPLPGDLPGFTRRFGLTVYTQYDQTETPPAIQSPALDGTSVPPPGYCGHLRPGFEARIVDENDTEVPSGSTGELILRCDAPWVIATWYYNKPDASIKAWRNGWFHTGDIFRQDSDGGYLFVDRSKDVIRRRGENISSFDIERALCQHGAIEAAAAFGVAGEFSEQEIMAVVQLGQDAPADPDAVIGHMSRNLPHFMVPRYLRFMSELPRSATDKVKKYDLQREGVTADTWDKLAQTGLRDSAANGDQTTKVDT